MIRIAIVDDDADFLRDVSFALIREGYRVSPFERGRDLLRHLQDGLPNLILLDRVLPDLDGFALCQRIKLRYPEATLMIFSSLGQAEDQIQGLSLGADDYLPKPFPMELLLLKVQTLLRRSNRQLQSGRIQTDRGLTLDRSQFRLLLNDQPVTLTTTEFNLLDLLMEQPGQLVTYETIMKRVMGRRAEDRDFQTIYFHITSLRKKLGSFRKRLETVRDRGYRYLSP